MSLSERITSVEQIRAWRDQIPLHYEYTAGVAGEKFLRGLQRGKILAARCDRCGRRYLPPKAYCVECFVPIRSYRQISAKGTVSGLAESHVAFDGSRLRSPENFVFVTFPGVTGGIVQKASGRGLRIGSRVKPRFKAESRRTGSLADFLFVPA